MGATRKTPETLTATLRSRVAAFFAARIPETAPLWVGLSGGRDSVVLLHLCRATRPLGSVRAIHVHHGLSQEADAWAAFCAELCATWEIPLTVTRVSVPKNAPEGLEAAARAARYLAYREHLAQHREGRFLALAHHRRDQAETLLFNLCRGAGVQGAAAMPAARDADGMTLLRPLLATDAAAIEDYAQAQGLVWHNDPSNADTVFTRNFLRHRILPELAIRFPGVEVSLSRAAGHFAEAASLLAERAAEDDALIQDRLVPLSTLSFARQANWLRWKIGSLGWRSPETNTLVEALRQFVASAPNAAKGIGGELRLPDGRVRAWRGRLYFLPQAAGEVPKNRPWDGLEALPWGGKRLCLTPCRGEGLSGARLAGRHLEVRTRQGGERFAPGRGRPHRPLKKLLQEAGVPPWERAQLPLLFCGEELIACPSVGVAAAWACAPDEAGLLPIWA